jgi:hypothetical protein
VVVGATGSWRICDMDRQNTGSAPGVFLSIVSV